MWDAEKALSYADGELDQRRHRILDVAEQIPDAELRVKRLQVALDLATSDLRKLELIRDGNILACEEMTRAVDILESEDFTEKQETEALDAIARYTRGNSIISRSNHKGY